MSDTTVVAITGFKKNSSLFEYLGLDSQRLNSRSLEVVIRVLGKLSILGIDPESSVELISSYEKKFGQSENSYKRLEKFDEFIKEFNSKQSLLEVADNIGLLSKAELEEQALETGNWIPFMKRVQKDKEKESDDNKADALGPKADIQQVSNK